MSLDKLHLLGDPLLHEQSERLEFSELKELKPLVEILHETLMAFREKYGAGRAIAAPQIGIHKRLVYLNIDKPQVLINPVLENKSLETFEVWDDCLSFPELFVKVKRHKRCSIKFTDMEGHSQSWDMEDDMSELLQHECDHLDGIMATQRAIDNKSLKHRPGIYNRIK